MSAFPLPPADVSFVIAAIPSEPIYSQVADASLAITARCRNWNVIDNSKFPCHVSLIISGASSRGMERLTGGLAALALQQASKSLASRLYISRGNTINIDVCGEVVRALHDTVVAVVASIQKSEPVIRPHLAERWPAMAPAQRRFVSEFGSYKVGNDFSAHISVAQVESGHAQEMFALAQDNVALPCYFSFREIQLVNVGHNNEYWGVIWSKVLDPQESD